MSTIEHFCKACQEERVRFRNKYIQESPACLELFRHSIALDREAQGCFYTIFEKDVASYTLRAVNRSACGLGVAHVPTIVSDVFFNILRRAENRADNHNQPLTSKTGKPPIETAKDFAQVMAWLHTIIKNAVSELCRKEAKSPEPASTDVLQERGQEPAISSIDTELIDRLIIRQFIEKHIKDEDSRKEQQNRIVTEWGLMQGMSNQEIHKMFAVWFDTVQDVENAKRRIQRALLRNPVFVSLYSPRQNSGSGTSLQFSLLDNVDEEFMQKKQDQFPPCSVGEEALLEYINESASIELVRLIESSPSCQRAVARLRDQLNFLQPLLREVFCPESETLIAYQEKRLTDRSRVEEVDKHLVHCHFCRQEITMLEAIDTRRRREELIREDSSNGIGAILRRLIHYLVYQPATLASVPALGAGSYRTVERAPQVELFIKTTKAHGKQRSWTVFGQVRAEGDRPFLEVESVIMRDLEDQEVAEYTATVDEEGRFTVKGLSAGTYQLRMIAGKEEIVLNDFKVEG